MDTPRLPVPRAAILKFLGERDGTHTEIADGTKQCHSSISLVLRDLHAEGLIHIGSYTKRTSRHKYVRTYRLGPGVDAQLGALDNAMKQNAAAVLALLKKGDMTYDELRAAMDWSSSGTRNVIRYMRHNKLMHVCEKIVGPLGQANMHKYRAGDADDAPGVNSPKPIEPAPKRTRVRPPTAPPLQDPLMAALFGR